MGSPLGLLTRLIRPLSRPPIRFPLRMEPGSSVSGARYPPMPGFSFTGFPNNPVVYRDDFTRDVAGLPG